MTTNISIQTDDEDLINRIMQLAGVDSQTEKVDDHIDDCEDPTWYSEENDDNIVNRTGNQDIPNDEQPKVLMGGDEMEMYEDTICPKCGGHHSHDECDMTDEAFMDGPCPHCGKDHMGPCEEVNEVEDYEGTDRMEPVTLSQARVGIQPQDKRDHKVVDPRYTYPPGNDSYDFIHEVEEISALLDMNANKLAPALMKTLITGEKLSTQDTEILAEAFQSALLRKEVHVMTALSALATRAKMNLIGELYENEVNPITIDTAIFESNIGTTPEMVHGKHSWMYEIANRKYQKTGFYEHVKKSMFEVARQQGVNTVKLLGF